MRQLALFLQEVSTVASEVLEGLTWKQAQSGVGASGTFERGLGVG